MTKEKTVEIPSETPFRLLPTPEANRDLAYARAIDSLSRYKFQMFGYWASLWVIFNQMSTVKQPNPFSDFVNLARQVKGGIL